MKADYVHKDTLTATDYVELNKHNELPMSYNQALLKENQSLKEQLEDKILLEMKLRNELFNKRKEYQDTYKDVRIEIKQYKTQQKEFIKWLEDYLNLFDYRDIQEQAGYDMLEEILQKYREIIGGKNE